MAKRCEECGEPIGSAPYVSTNQDGGLYCHKTQGDCIKAMGRRIAELERERHVAK